MNSEHTSHFGVGSTLAPRSRLIPSNKLSPPTTNGSNTPQFELVGSHAGTESRPAVAPRKPILNNQRSSVPGMRGASIASSPPQQPAASQHIDLSLSVSASPMQMMARGPSLTAGRTSSSVPSRIASTSSHQQPALRSTTPIATVIASARDTVATGTMGSDQQLLVNVRSLQRDHIRDSPTPSTRAYPPPPTSSIAVGRAGGMGAGERIAVNSKIRLRREAAALGGVALGSAAGGVRPRYSDAGAGVDVENAVGASAPVGTSSVHNATPNTSVHAGAGAAGSVSGSTGGSARVSRAPARSRIPAPAPVQQAVVHVAQVTQVTGGAAVGSIAHEATDCSNNASVSVGVGTDDEGNEAQVLNSILTRTKHITPTSQQSPPAPQPTTSAPLPRQLTAAAVDALIDAHQAQHGGRGGLLWRLQEQMRRREGAEEEDEEDLPLRTVDLGPAVGSAWSDAEVEAEAASAFARMMDGADVDEGADADASVGVGAVDSMFAGLSRNTAVLSAGAQGDAQAAARERANAAILRRVLTQQRRARDVDVVVTYSDEDEDEEEGQGQGVREEEEEERGVSARTAVRVAASSTRVGRAAPLMRAGSQRHSATSAQAALADMRAVDARTSRQHDADDDDGEAVTVAVIPTTASPAPAAPLRRVTSRAALHAHVHAQGSATVTSTNTLAASGCAGVASPSATVGGDVAETAVDADACDDFCVTEDYTHDPLAAQARLARTRTKHMPEKTLAVSDILRYTGQNSLAAVRELTVRRAALTHLPAALAQCPQLVALDLSHNSLRCSLQADAPLLPPAPLANRARAGQDRESLRAHAPLEVSLGHLLCAPPALSLLSSLSSLTHLTLAGNRIRDMSFVLALPALESLTLTSNLISHVPSLAALPRLQHLRLAHNAIETVGCTCACAPLTAAGLSSPPSPDGAAPVDTPAAETAVLPCRECARVGRESAAAADAPAEGRPHRRSSDAHALSRSLRPSPNSAVPRAVFPPSIVSIDLANNQLTLRSLAPLALHGLPALQVLNLAANNIDPAQLPATAPISTSASARAPTPPTSSPSPSLRGPARPSAVVAALPRARPRCFLDVSLPALAELDLSYNQLTRPAPLPHAPALHTLALAGNRLTTLRGVRGAELCELYVAGNLLIDLRGLLMPPSRAPSGASTRRAPSPSPPSTSSVPAAASTPDVEGRSDACAVPSLEVLDLSHNSIADTAVLSQLAQLPALFELSLAGNPLQRAKGSGYRLSVLRAVGVGVLDERQVTPQEREMGARVAAAEAEEGDGAAEGKDTLGAEDMIGGEKSKEAPLAAALAASGLEAALNRPLVDVPVSVAAVADGQRALQQLRSEWERLKRRMDGQEPQEEDAGKAADPDTGCMSVTATPPSDSPATPVPMTAAAADAITRIEHIARVASQRVRSSAAINPTPPEHAVATIPVPTAVALARPSSSSLLLRGLASVQDAAQHVPLPPALVLASPASIETVPAPDPLLPSARAAHTPSHAGYTPAAAAPAPIAEAPHDDGKLAALRRLASARSTASRPATAQRHPPAAATTPVSPAPDEAASGVGPASEISAERPATRLPCTGAESSAVLRALTGRRSLLTAASDPSRTTPEAPSFAAVASAAEDEDVAALRARRRAAMERLVEVAVVGVAATGSPKDTAVTINTATAMSLAKCVRSAAASPRPSTPAPPAPTHPVASAPAQGPGTAECAITSYAAIVCASASAGEKTEKAEGADESKETETPGPADAPPGKAVSATRVSRWAAAARKQDASSTPAAAAATAIASAAEQVPAQPHSVPAARATISAHAHTDPLAMQSRLAVAARGMPAAAVGTRVRTNTSVPQPTPVSASAAVRERDEADSQLDLEAEAPLFARLHPSRTHPASPARAPAPTLATQVVGTGAASLAARLTRPSSAVRMRPATNPSAQSSATTSYSVQEEAPTATTTNETAPSHTTLTRQPSYKLSNKKRGY